MSISIKIIKKGTEVRFFWKLLSTASLTENENLFFKRAGTVSFAKVKIKYKLRADRLRNQKYDCTTDSGTHTTLLSFMER